jgi:hypothetical protein
LFSLLFFSRARESSSAIRGAQQQQHGTANPFAVRCISHPMNRFVLPPSTSEILHCVVAQLPALIVNGNDSAAMTADRKEENKKKEEEKRPQRKCDNESSASQICQLAIIEATTFSFLLFLLCGGPCCCSLLYMTVATATQTFAGTAFGLKTDGLPKKKERKRIEINQK